MNRRRVFVLVALAAALLSAAAGTTDVPVVAGSGDAPGLGSLHTTTGTIAIRLELPAPAPTTLVIEAAASAAAPAVRLTPPAPPISEAPAPVLSNEEIIRAVWPDELEDHAVAIAYRESRLNCCVRTFCCFGLFQIYWTTHRSWLVDLGIVSVGQLYDPWLNARAALELYHRADVACASCSGWDPWSL